MPSNGRLMCALSALLVGLGSAHAAKAQDVMVYGRPNEVACSRKADAALLNPNGYAFIVGNRQYQSGVPEVAYAHNDAKAVCDFVVNRLGYPAGQVFVILDADRTQLETWFESDDRYISAARKLTGAVGDELEVFFYYSGHGMPQDDDAFLLPTNVSPTQLGRAGFGVDRLSDELADLGAKRALVVLEACFSGRTVSKDGAIPLTSYAVSGADVNAHAEVTILTAAGPDEVANWDLDREKGLYTAEFLESAGGRADQYGDKDGVVTLAELVTDLGRSVPSRSIQVVPGDIGRIQTPSAEGPLDAWSFKVPEKSVETAALSKPEPEEPQTRGIPKVEQPKPAPVPTVETKRTETVEPDPPTGNPLDAIGGRKPTPPTKETKIAAVQPDVIQPEVLEKSLAITRPQWRSVQAALAKQGFDAGPVDGVPGPATREQIAAWQGSRNEPRTGFLADRQLASLLGITPQPPSPTKPAVGVFDVNPASSAGKSFKDCDQCPEMVTIKPGSFLMGASGEDKAWLSEQSGGNHLHWAETPRHKVNINYSFAVGKYEVTIAEYQFFLQSSGYQPAGGCWYWTGRGWKEDRRLSWSRPDFQQTPTSPVACIAWEDAKAYARWLSDHTGQDYHLLSEAEWEYAARGGNGAIRPWANPQSNEVLCEKANGADLSGKGRYRRWATTNNCQDGHANTAPVGSYSPNGYGLYDMIGNVAEWVEDIYHSDYSTARGDGSALTTGGSTKRALRGGSWQDEPWDLRSAARGSYTATTRVGDIGFRVAKSL